MFEVKYACTLCQHDKLPEANEPCFSCIPHAEGWTGFTPVVKPELRPASEIMAELARKMATANGLAARAAEAETSLNRTLGTMRSLLAELNQHIK